MKWFIECGLSVKDLQDSPGEIGFLRLFLHVIAFADSRSTWPKSILSIFRHQLFWLVLQLPSSGISTGFGRRMSRAMATTLPLTWTVSGLASGSGDSVQSFVTRLFLSKVCLQVCKVRSCVILFDNIVQVFPFAIWVKTVDTVWSNQHFLDPGAFW